MSNSSSSNSFFDSRFFLAVALIIVCWVGWQAYMVRKYPETYQQKSITKDVAPLAKDETPKPNEKSVPSLPTAPEVAQERTIEPETILKYDDSVWSFEISSQGMALRNVHLKKFSDREGHPITFAGGNDLGLFSTSLMGRRDPLVFSMRKTADNEIVGVAQVDGMKVTKILHVDSPNYSVPTQIRVENISDVFTGLATTFSDYVHKVTESSFLMPQFEHQEFYTYHSGSDSRLAVNPEKMEMESYSQTKIAAFGSQYFAAAVVDRSTIMPEFKAMTVIEGQARSLGTLTYSLLNKTDKFVLNYVGFAGPKSFELLKSIDTDMTNLIDLGLFYVYLKLILGLMKSIYSAMGNWGVAIIFLTLIVRVIVLPFNIIGYKQMKALAKIQPEMKALRERYKDEPQRLNQEMLRVMREAKANPLGGCLPMFLQIPVFLALYQVIGQSIELYQAPFIFWINDLSLKDPYFVLPILMGITMYFQQKITPSTMEPAQQKVMMFLPVFLTFLMGSLPSGLTLYIFVSTLFGVLQQLYFMKDNKSVTANA